MKCLIPLCNRLNRHFLENIYEYWLCKIWKGSSPDFWDLCQKILNPGKQHSHGVQTGLKPRLLEFNFSYQFSACFSLHQVKAWWHVGRSILVRWWPLISEIVMFLMIKLVAEWASTAMKAFLRTTGSQTPNGSEKTERLKRPKDQKDQMTAASQGPGWKMFWPPKQDYFLWLLNPF